MRHVFIGLRMKALILLSALLLIVFSGLTLLNAKNIKGFFDIERQEVFKNQELRLKAQFTKVYNDLTLIAQSSFDKYAEYDTAPQAFWAWGNLSQGYSHPIKSMLLLDEYGDLSRSFGEPNSAAVTAWAGQLDAIQEPWLLDCQLDCRIYFATGISGDDQFGTVVLGVDARDFLGSLVIMDSAKFFLASAASDSAQAVRLLQTSIAPKEPLSQVLAKLTLDDLKLEPAWLELSDQTFELHHFNIVSTTEKSLVYLVIMSDISAQVAHLREANKNNFVYSAGALATALLLFALLLKGPLSRVRQVIGVLPLLASSRYHLFRQTIAENQSTLFIDETDELGDAAMRVSQQLEHLENQLKNRADELEWIANHDNLTELPNRRKFESMLCQAISSELPGCLLLVDLDNFKYVNDISGHDAGDEMLRHVAMTLQRLLPEDAIIARISGDEFSVYQQGLSIELAEVVAQRLFNLIGQVSVPGRDTIHTASASIGIVAYPLHDNTSAGLMSKADLCIFQAKAQGKHCVVVYQNTGQGGDIAHQHYWLELAQHAIARDCLELAYQPILNNKTQVIQHYEVLLRVRDQQGQLQSPYELILAAEKNGYISQIDIWVLRSALDQLERNLKRGIKDRLAINLSARTFCSEKTINQIAHEFDNRDIRGEMIIFEITETASLPNMEQAQLHISRLKNIGCAIALDDFGVGYSSFHSLKELDFDYIKIDGSFVTGILQNKKNSYFIEALVGIAHHLGYRTIAEFVESHELNEQLVKLGVDYSQGYFIGKPSPADQVWNSERTADVLSLRPQVKQH
jgi:diguanylate cyclase (GGDEF)-like protein